jgi:peptidyl-prolyl cis-trans isomerase D
MSGVQMPSPAADAMMDYVGARRSFTMATLTAADLDNAIPTPTDADLRAFYEANSDSFTLPQTKRITYAVLRPDALLDEVEVDADAVKRLYDDRAEQFNVPERRLVERLVLENDEAAASAKAQLEVGGTTFDQLVQDRGLSLADIDMGDVAGADLGEAAEAVCAAQINDVVGPRPSPFGPALYRVNGTLAERITSFESVEQELRDELAGERARRLIEGQAEDIEDLLAGGATPEDLANETDMELAQIDWSIDSADGIAAYDAFRQAASAVTLEDFPTVTFLEDGGIFAMQLDEVLPPRPEPFEDAADRVRVGWELEQTATALRARADAVINELATSNDFTAIGLPTRVENGLTRTAYLDGTPPDFMTQVFEMAEGEMRVIGTGDTMYVVRLDGTQPPEDTPELTQMRNALALQLDQALAQALFEAFVRDAQLRAQPMLDQRAVNAVQSSFQ